MTYTERLQVSPAPEPAALSELAPSFPVSTRFDYGHDARGGSRLTMTLSHAEPERVAQARQHWLQVLSELGLRAFVV